MRRNKTVKRLLLLLTGEMLLVQGIIYINMFYKDEKKRSLKVSNAPQLLETEGGAETCPKRN